MKHAIISRIGERAPMQKKKIEKFFHENPDAETGLAEFLDMYKPYMEKEALSALSLADAYLQMVEHFMYSRLEFVRTGVYPKKCQETALNEVYTQQSTMQAYMLGLALSYFLWKHHFKLLTFLRQSIEGIQPDDALLEVGCGHGLFLVDVFKRVRLEKHLDVVDISEYSIEMTNNLLQTVFPAISGQVVFHHCDFMDYDQDRRYDYIIAGEVLEHMDNPGEFLNRLSGYMTRKGRLFITTCANCPAIDHVYHFKTIQEIRDTIEDAGLVVEEELIAPSEDKSMSYIEKNMIDISYAAIAVKNR